MKEYRNMNDPHRNRQQFITIGISVLVAFGLFVALTSGVSLADGLLSLVVPVSIAAVLVAYRQPLGTILTARLSPDRATERQHYLAMRDERDDAEQRVRLAEAGRATAEAAQADAEAVNASLCGALENAYRELYDTSKSGQLTHLQLIRAFTNDLRLTRQKADGVDAVTTEKEKVVREREELRGRLADALNAPPPPLTWSVVLPWVDYGATNSVAVRKLRDAFRDGGVAIPDSEYADFSAAVRALPSYSPTKGKGAPAPVLSVTGEPSPTDTGSHGRTPAPTDTRTPRRTPRTGTAKALPRATKKAQVEA